VGANPSFRTLGDFVRQNANLLIECRACDNKSVLDAAKVARWFHCHGWGDVIEAGGSRFRCRVCRGRPAYIRATMEKPTRADWMQHEYQWGHLVKRLRNR
jgi:hypothetical protein